MSQPLLRALLVVLDADGRTALASHRIRREMPALLVGRSMACDVVLSDPFVAAEHFEVGFDTEGHLRIHDLGSVNGTRLDHAAAPEHVVRDEGLHTIDIGRTRLSLRAQSAVIAPEQRLESAHDRGPAHAAHPPSDPPRLAQVLGGPRVFAAIALAGLALMSYLHWLQTSWQREVWMQVTAGVLGSLIGGAAWVGFWALIGRVANGKPRWLMQAGIAVAMALVYVIGREAADLAGFATSRVLPSVTATIWATACTVLVLYAHLRTATHLRTARSALLAAALPLAVSGMLLWQQYGVPGGREWRHTDGAALYPPAMRAVAPAPTSALMADARELRQRAVDRMKRVEAQEASVVDDDEGSLFD